MMALALTAAHLKAGLVQRERAQLDWRRPCARTAPARGGRDERQHDPTPRQMSPGRTRATAANVTRTAAHTAYGREVRGRGHRDDRDGIKPTTFARGRGDGCGCAGRGEAGEPSEWSGEPLTRSGAQAAAASPSTNPPAQGVCQALAEPEDEQRANEPGDAVATRGLSMPGNV